MVGGVQQDLALGGHIPGGEPLQVPADDRAGGVEVLGVDPGVTGGGALLGVDHVHHAVVHRRQPGRGIGDQAGHRGVIDGGHDHAGARPGTADRPGCWNWNQGARPAALPRSC